MRAYSRLARPSIPVLVGVVAAMACVQAPAPPSTDTVLKFESCAGGVRTMSFLLSGPYAGSINPLEFIGGSSHVVGTPTVTNISAHEVQVTVELNNVNAGDDITLTYRYHPLPPQSGAGDPGIRGAHAHDIKFYPVPPSQLPAQLTCAPYASLSLVAIPNANGVELEVANYSPAPLDVGTLEIAMSPTVLPSSSLDWDDATFNSLSWNVLLSDETLNPFEVIIFPLEPEEEEMLALLTSNASVLTRHMTSFFGLEASVFTQFRLQTGTVSVHETTWGQVKALYR